MDNLRDILEVGDKVEVDIWDSGLRETIVSNIIKFNWKARIYQVLVTWPHKGNSTWWVSVDLDMSPDKHQNAGRVIRRLCPTVEKIREENKVNSP